MLAAIGALQLVFNFSEKAGEHGRLRRRFCDVLARATVLTTGSQDAPAPAELVESWAAIWADEPPTLHVLEAVAHNAAKRAVEGTVDEDGLIEINWVKNWTRNLSAWEGFEPLTRRERRERAWTQKPYDRRAHDGRPASRS